MTPGNRYLRATDRARSGTDTGAETIQPHDPFRAQSRNAPDTPSQAPEFQPAQQTTADAVVSGARKSIWDYICCRQASSFPDVTEPQTRSSQRAGTEAIELAALPPRRAEAMVFRIVPPQEAQIEEVAISTLSQQEARIPGLSSTWQRLPASTLGGADTTPKGRNKPGDSQLRGSSSNKGDARTGRIHDRLAHHSSRK
jgi:hypothetical protein